MWWVGGEPGKTATINCIVPLKSIATRNVVVYKQSLEDQVAQHNKDLENAKADVTVLTTTPSLESRSAKASLDGFRMG